MPTVAGFLLDWNSRVSWTRVWWKGVQICNQSNWGTRMWHWIKRV